MRRAATLGCLVLAGALVVRLLAQGPLNTKVGIINSKHDFRARSTAAIRSVSGQDACVFCHTPHNAADSSSYLWNHTLSMRDHPTYSSSTLQSTVIPISSRDVSKLCLSCHDGSIAAGETVNDGTIPFLQGASYTLPASSSSNIAGDQTFSSDHPFGFAPQMGRELQSPPSHDAVKLDGNGKIQCTSCHDPHNENIDTTIGKFLVKANASSELCLSCHQKAGWANSAHRMPPDIGEDAKYTSNQGAHTGYIGIGKNGCESCHRPHAAQEPARLVKFVEENTCFQCHDGSVANRNIESEFLSKTYKHPVLITPSVHDASESPNSGAHTLPETAAGAPRHSECSDCHNPHYANNTAAQPPLVSGALLGVKGQSAANAYLPVASNQYEICFKCHGDSANQPQALDQGTVGIGYGRNPQRNFLVGLNAVNVRLQFTESSSFHPVTRVSNVSQAEVPSLRPTIITPGGSPVATRPLSSASVIYCTDCHNNDSGRNLDDSSSGPSGPHGSNIPHLLEREYVLETPPAQPGLRTSGAIYATRNYALCDKCHDVSNSVLQDRSFPTHQEHVRAQGAACSTCHDPHGSTGPMLVNFDRSLVSPSSNGRLQYSRLGPGHGSCSLTCHGKDHNAQTY